jgi:hypothetical protein
LFVVGCWLLVVCCWALVSGLGGRWSAVICPLSFVICYLLFVVCHLLFVICLVADGSSLGCLREDLSVILSACNSDVRSSRVMSHIDAATAPNMVLRPA